MRHVSDYTPVWEVSRTQNKRRKLSDDQDQEEHSEPTFSDDDEQSSIRPASASSSARLDPFYVAGQNSAKPLPPSPYPHGSATGRKTRATAAVHDDQVPSMNMQHLAVMTNIMHTSLLRGDFIRAGGAWGMLLRSSSTGRGIDLRKHGRWGIGAEILLRRDASVPLMPTSRAEDGDPAADNLRTDRSPDDELLKVPQMSKEAFTAAQEYYEQLLLQYPYRKHVRKTIDALTFYPAMFGLLIYEAVEMSKRAIPRLGDEASAVSSPSSSGPNEVSHETEIANIKRAELDAALQIAARLDELMLTPPYDKLPSILQLRGMVGLWVADLHEDSSPPAVAPDAGGEVDSSTERLQPYAARQESYRNVERARAEREKARNCFARVVKVGGKLPSLVRSVVE